MHFIRIPVSVHLHGPSRWGPAHVGYACPLWIVVSVGIAYLYCCSLPTPFPQPLGCTFHLPGWVSPSGARSSAFFSCRVLVFPLANWDVGPNHWLNYRDKREMVLLLRVPSLVQVLGLAGEMTRSAGAAVFQTHLSFTWEVLSPPHHFSLYT